MKNEIEEIRSPLTSDRVARAVLRQERRNRRDQSKWVNEFGRPTTTSYRGQRPTPACVSTGSSGWTLCCGTADETDLNAYLPRPVNVLANSSPNYTTSLQLKSLLSRSEAKALGLDRKGTPIHLRLKADQKLNTRTELPLTQQPRRQPSSSSTRSSNSNCYRQRGFARISCLSDNQVVTRCKSGTNPYSLSDDDDEEDDDDEDEDDDDDASSSGAAQEEVSRQYSARDHRMLRVTERTSPSTPSRAITKISHARSPVRGAALDDQGRQFIINRFGRPSGLLMMPRGRAVSVSPTYHRYRRPVSSADSMLAENEAADFVGELCPSPVPSSRLPVTHTLGTASISSLAMVGAGADSSESSFHYFSPPLCEILSPGTPMTHHWELSSQAMASSRDSRCHPVFVSSPLPSVRARLSSRRDDGSIDITLQESISQQVELSPQFKSSANLSVPPQTQLLIPDSRLQALDSFRAKAALARFEGHVTVDAIVKGPAGVRQLKGFVLNLRRVTMIDNTCRHILALSRRKRSKIYLLAALQIVDCSQDCLHTARLSCGAGSDEDWAALNLESNGNACVCYFDGHSMPVILLFYSAEDAIDFIELLGLLVSETGTSRVTQFILYEGNDPMKKATNPPTDT